MALNKLHKGVKANMKVIKLNESASDGWNLEHFEIINVLNDIEDLTYEIKNAYRGYRSGARTHEELADYIRTLSQRLNDAADEIEEATESDIDESYCKEDTIKTKSGKWVNKGDTGETHGEFRTKKEADAQRRAIFANWKK